jgi:alpha-tubulin suppressor-like RCC1 family protein
MKVFLIIIISFPLFGCDDDPQYIENNTNNQISCGNGQLDENETCDGTLVRETCGENGYWSGKPTCDSCCFADYSSCEVVDIMKLGTYQTSCALTTSGNAYCWGTGEYGEIGNGEFLQQIRATPVLMPSEIRFEDITVGYNNVHALDMDGRIWRWGINDYGEANNLSKSSIPLLFESAIYIYPYTKIESGGMHSCALDSSGSLWCWGKNFFGSLGIGSSEILNVALPQKIVTNDDVAFVDFSVGYISTCGLDINGNIWCWGENKSNMLCNNETVDTTVPVKITPPDGVDFSEVSVGNGMISIKTSEGGVYICGTRMETPELTKVEFPEDITIAQMSDDHGITNIGTIVNWHYFSSGDFQLEDVSTGGINKVIKIHAGLQAVFFIDNDGYPWATGFNDKGMLGVGEEGTYRFPVKLLPPL